ncbi:MAG TPA: Na-translocating system protein MpsC family protein [Solirubrobacterales bacterium]|nr:Na-translocating system protein MpsC family protein [Solirubrobacterales bacterium]
MTREVIRIHMEAIGRGPRRAYTFHNDNVLFTILEGTMTPGEQKLAANGDGESVRAIKRQFHRVMDEDLRDAVKRLTAKQVVATLSDIHLDPDVAVELFILDSSLVQGNGLGHQAAR